MDIPSLFRVVNSPASSTDLACLVASYNGILPTSYLEFLGRSDGVESCIHDRGGDCLVMWSASEIAAMNASYEIPRWLPEFLAIGSDGGDDAIGFDRSMTDPERWPIVRIGFGNLDRVDFVRLGNGFADWHARGFPLRGLESDQ